MTRDAKDSASEMRQMMCPILQKIANNVALLLVHFIKHKHLISEGCATVPWPYAKDDLANIISSSGRSLRAKTELGL